MSPQCTIDHLILLEPHSLLFRQLTPHEQTIIFIQRFRLLFQLINAAYDEYYKAYFDLLRINMEKRVMLRKRNLAQFIVNTILDTKEYNLYGIAYYAHVPIDIIHDIKIGILIYPSCYVMDKLFELFFSVKKELCQEIFEKISNQKSQPTLLS